jgi:hypothetical protein
MIRIKLMQMVMEFLMKMMKMMIMMEYPIGKTRMMMVTE